MKDFIINSVRFLYNSGAFSFTSYGVSKFFGVERNKLFNIDGDIKCLCINDILPLIYADFFDVEDKFSIQDIKLNYNTKNRLEYVNILYNMYYQILKIDSNATELLANIDNNPRNIYIMLNKLARRNIEENFYFNNIEDLIKSLEILINEFQNTIKRNNKDGKILYSEYFYDKKEITIDNLFAIIYRYELATGIYFMDNKEDIYKILNILINIGKYCNYDDILSIIESCFIIAQNNMHSKVEYEDIIISIKNNKSINEDIKFDVIDLLKMYQNHTNISRIKRIK